jgi:spermidine dehydrogenase
LPGGGMSASDQFRAGRQELLGTTFETFEREIRSQLNAMLAPGGFDPRRDILGITVNRWPHGYAVGINEKTGRLNWFSREWADEDKAWLTGRERFGRIAFANTDAAASAMTESAIDQAWRATQELAE